jgi:DNA adenine methylase
MQQLLFGEELTNTTKPFREQLLKWVGNKQRFAHEIASYFPTDFKTYFEPFLGSGAVLGTLAPTHAVASDCFKPLIEIWQTLHDSPDTVKQWYASRWHAMKDGNKGEVFERIKASYNANPNPADLLFLCRTCYGGIVRFRKMDGYMSTPCGVHSPMPPDKFSRRVDEWRRRTAGVSFQHLDFEQAMNLAEEGDLIYCDPPYTDSQSILYGAQEFSVNRLFQVIERCKRSGVYVALSIDGIKQSGNKICNVEIPDYLFAREVYVNCGRSMLRRFQMPGQTLESEVVHDRLLLTF